MPRLALLGAACVTLLAVAAPAAAAPGSLDGSFGSGGVLLLSVGGGGQSAGNGIATGPAGGLLAGGEAIEGTESQFVLLRLDDNGTPASVGTTLTSIGGDAAGAGLVVQADGRPVVAGYGGAGGNVFAATRYAADGSLDTAGFGTGGIAQLPVGADMDSAARAVALYAPDRLLLGGRALDVGGYKMALVRLLADGSSDPSFSSLFAVGDGGEATAQAVATQTDGKVLAAGYARDAGEIKVALVRRLGNGDPDTEFGAGSGIVLLAAGDGHEAIANALAMQTDGKLLVAGSASNGGTKELLLARFNADGSPDTGFGTSGTVLTPIGDGDDVAASALAVPADGRIVVAGHASDSGGTNLMVARYNADGTPDASFGTGGSSLVPLGDDGAAEANALVLQRDCAVVTGYASNGGENKTVLARLTLVDPPTPCVEGPPPPPDTTPPTLTASMTHKQFRVGKGTSAFTARKRAPVGTAFRYTLSEAARVTIRLERATKGVRRGKRCVKPTKRRHGKRCTRFVRVGRLVRESPLGKTKVPFNGRIKRRALKLGNYRAVIFAVDAAGNTSASKRLKFKVVR
jgi:uncharacterized delta-60 repeat protein